MSTNTARPALATTSVVDRPWWQLAIVAAVVAAVANLIVYAIAEGPAGLNLRVPNQQAGGDLVDLGPGPVVLFSVLPAAVAALLAAGLARWSSTPRRWFLAIALVVLAVSFLPLVGADLPTSTRLTLGIMHVVTAGAIIAPFARRLTNRDR